MTFAPDPDDKEAMSEAIAEKKGLSAGEKVWLGVIGVLILGLMIFSSGGDKAPTTPEDTTTETAKIAAPESASEAKEDVAAMIGAGLGRATDLGAIEPAPATSQAGSDQAETLAETRAALAASEKRIAELEAQIKSSTGLTQEALSRQAEIYQARYTDLLKRVNDVTKGFDRAIEDHAKAFSEETVK